MGVEVSSTTVIKIERAYEPAEHRDGYRVLIDRLWPRGILKGELKLDEWAKDLAPSPDLRKLFGHDPEKWREFSAKYRIELRAIAAREKIKDLARRARRSNLTLGYGAKDEDHNDAVILRDILVRALGKSAPKGRRSSKKAA